MFVLILLSAITSIIYPPLRTVKDYGPVVTDIESHLPARHPYREKDKIGWVHEGTHGINSQLRNTYHRPGFYVLKNRAVLLTEPNITLRDVARAVPKSLRGRCYNTYFVQARRSWNQQPTYVFDEWVAYINGSEARHQLGISKQRATVSYMMELCVYSLCVAKASNDQRLKPFIKQQMKRTLDIYAKSGVPSRLLATLRRASDAKSLRDFCRRYFGKQWTRTTLGF